MDSPEPRPGQPKRRTISPAQKLAYIEAYEQAIQNGEGRGYLRANALYSSHIVEWRRLCDAGTLDGTAANTTGSKASGRLSKEQAEIARLKKQLAPHPCHHSIEGSSTVAFQASLAFESVKDRFDPLAHPAQRSEPGLLVLPVRTNQHGFHLLGDDVLEVLPGENPSSARMTCPSASRSLLASSIASIASRSPVFGLARPQITGIPSAGGDQKQPEAPEVA